LVLPFRLPSSPFKFRDVANRAWDRNQFEDGAYLALNDDDLLVTHPMQFVRKTMKATAEEFSRVDWVAAVSRSVAAFLSEAPSLLDPVHPQGEVAVTHRLAHHLANEVEASLGVFVDVELHRDGSGLKPSLVGDYARIDIVVHRRDPTNEGNLLAIEVKWDDEKVAKLENARKKLKVYLGDRLRYAFAALLTLPRRRSEVTLEWIEKETGTAPRTRLVLARVGATV